MVATSNEQGSPDQGPDSVIARRGGRWRRIAALIGLSLLLLLLIAIAAVWIARRPIASNILEREFERRGVRATYDLERVGLRTQVVRNLVIGDPEDPDLFARYALIQLRIGWDGSLSVYRVVARGVRLEGRVVNGRVSWGELDRMLPPPSDQPFRFPEMTVDVADTSISLQTPAGPLGFAVRGSGNLTGGFEGLVAARSPVLDFGGCSVSSVTGNFEIEIVARRPHVEGPLAADRFACPASHMGMSDPRFVIDARFDEGFGNFKGEGRISARQIVAGANGLAALTGNISFEGSPGDARGQIELAARQSRLGPVFADRTRLDGRYRLDAEAGTLAMVSEFRAQDASLAPAIIGGITNPLAGLENTPVGPVTAAISRALRANARSFDASGEIRIVNAPGGGAARVESVNVETDAGGRVRIAGGDGLSYYWPSGNLRLDGRLQMAGGGLPAGELVLRQPRPGAALTGIARLQPYRAGRNVLALQQPLRFRAVADGSTDFSTVLQVSGPFPEGNVQNLRLPVSGTLGAAGGFRIGRNCIVASADSIRFRDLSLGPTRLPICPEGQDAIISQTPGGEIRFGVAVPDLAIQGRLGDSPLRLTADRARLVGDRNFSLTGATMRLGDPDSPIVVQADRLQGTFRGSGVSGTLSDAEVVIGDVPLRIYDADARWRFQSGDLFIEDDLMVADRAEEARFYPLLSNDFRFTMSGNDIRAGGTLRHPESGIAVTDVTIEHDLDSGAGHAVLDVPGLTFGENLQPEELTPLTEGVVALVQGRIRGQGRIEWDPEGETTSTGEFTTVGMDLAAPFGPVEGLSTTIRFTDLLGLETAPGQVARVDLINPGIPVRDGVITYQILPEQRVRIQRGIWPFMGGQLILRETVLNFAREGIPKRLTFQVIGFEASRFIESLGFEGIMITGTFDGVLPMIFDDEGGRIVGGRLDSRPPGGRFRYTGTKPDAGLIAGVAFDLLSDIRYGSMIIRLDGDLAGEFATRFTIRNVSLGDEGGFIAGLVRNAFKNVPMIVNLNITGPFRALIQMGKAFEDPTEVIEPVMPFPLDAPGIVTETRNLRKEEDQTRTTPLDEVEITPEPQQPSE